jgi:hypothetical protein
MRRVGRGWGDVEGGGWQYSWEVLQVVIQDLMVIWFSGDRGFMEVTLRNCREAGLLPMLR